MTHRVNHALKVLGLARCIATNEHVTNEATALIELAAVLHDIAIRHCEQTYGSCAGHLQEREGRDEGAFSQEAFQNALRKYFKTQASKELAWLMFGHV